MPYQLGDTPRCKFFKRFANFVLKLICAIHFKKMAEVAGLEPTNVRIKT